MEKPVPEKPLKQRLMTGDSEIQSVTFSLQTHPGISFSLKEFKKWKTKQKKLFRSWKGK